MTINAWAYIKSIISVKSTNNDIHTSINHDVQFITEPVNIFFKKIYFYYTTCLSENNNLK